MKTYDIDIEISGANPLHCRLQGQSAEDVIRTLRSKLDREHGILDMQAEPGGGVFYVDPDKVAWIKASEVPHCASVVIAMPALDSAIVKAMIEQDSRNAEESMTTLRSMGIPPH